MRRRFVPLLLVLLGLVLGAPAPAPAADPPPVRVLDSGHIDIEPRFVGDELRIQWKTNNGSLEQWTDIDDALLYIGKTGRIQVPVEGTQGKTWDFIAPQGSPVWWMPEAAKPGLPWAGFNVAPSDRFEREFSLVLEGVSGPGEAIMQDQGLPFFSTRSGLPAIRPLAGHFHMSWYFTEPGVYCLALAAAGRERLTGERLDARGQVTVVTEPVNPATVAPCGRASAPPQASPPPVAEGARGGTPLIARDQHFELRPSVEDGTFTTTLVQRSGRDSGIVRRPEDVVFYLRAASAQAPSAPWQASGGEVWQNGNGPRIDWSTLGIDPDEIDGDVSLRLLDVEGPGSFSLDDRSSRTIEGRPILSDAPGYEQAEYPLWARSASFGNWSFSAPGVYCVGLELAATPSGGTEITRRLDLTFAVDEPELRYSAGAYHPVAATIDPTRVTPCAREGEPADPTVLRRGHLDLSTRLLDGALDVSVKDDSAVPVVHRAPSGVLVEVGPRAMVPVPDDPAFAFLGSPGEPLWVLPQVQDPDLPWPGWSTETLGAAQLAGPVGWQLRAVRGPGEFALWTSDEFGVPAVLFNSRDGLPDVTEIPLGTHAHGNWSFSRPGLYCLDLRMSATTSFGRAVSREQTLAFAVGVEDLAGLGVEDCPASGPPRDGGPVPVGDPPAAGPPPPARAPGPVRLVLRLDRAKLPARGRAGGALSAVQDGRPASGTARVRVDGRPRLALRFDGARRSLRFRLPALPRGQHRLTAAFTGAAGRVLSRPVVLTVKPALRTKNTRKKESRR